MTPTSKTGLNIHIYADGANKEHMLKRAREGVVKGFTTNPTLMAKAGIRDYAAFAKEVLSEIRDLPISFEVFSDEFDKMEREAMIIREWGSNVNVKIPIINTQGQSTVPLIRKLLDQGLRLNVTALFTQQQLDGLRAVLTPKDDVLVSIFAGRMADTGVDPLPLIQKAVADFRPLTGSKILWASTREALNVYQADSCGCHIITAPDDVIQKVITQRGRTLEDLTLDTVRTFLADSQKAGFSL